MNASADCLLQVSKVYGRFRWLLTMGKQKCMDASRHYWPGLTGSFNTAYLRFKKGSPALKQLVWASIQCLSYGCNPCPALNSPLKAKMKEMTASKNRSINCSCKSFIEKHYTTQYKPALKLSLILLLYSILFIYLHTPFFHLPPPHPFSPIPHGWEGPFLAEGCPLGITRLQFYLHLACREMV